ncbi:hypothetical protein L1887_60213 [Cichorium endivia]|nr:hypothetical protein L1887_60213 [Cichorium endivia]
MSAERESDEGGWLRISRAPRVNVAPRLGQPRALAGWLAGWLARLGWAFRSLARSLALHASPSSSSSARRGDEKSTFRARWRILTSVRPSFHFGSGFLASDIRKAPSAASWVGRSTLVRRPTCSDTATER